MTKKTLPEIASRIAELLADFKLPPEPADIVQVVYDVDTDALRVVEKWDEEAR
jgi:hypothetical protein